MYKLLGGVLFSQCCFDLYSVRRGDVFFDHCGDCVFDLRFGLLFHDGCIELRGYSSRMGFPRLHDGGHGVGHVLVARGHALQLAHVLRDGDHLQRREPVRTAHKLELGWSDKF